MDLDRRFIRDPDLAKRWGVSPMFIYRHEKSDPDFPPKYRLGARMNCRRVEDVEAYEKSKREVSDACPK